MAPAGVPNRPDWEEEEEEEEYIIEEGTHSSSSESRQSSESFSIYCYDSKNFSMRLLAARLEAGVLPVPPPLTLQPTLLLLLARDGLTSDATNPIASSCLAPPSCNPPLIRPKHSPLSSDSSCEMSKARGLARAVFASVLTSRSAS